MYNSGHQDSKNRDNLNKKGEIQRIKVEKKDLKVKVAKLENYLKELIEENRKLKEGS